MECDQVTDDMLDEYIMGRPSPPRLGEHLASCVNCAERFADRRDWVEIMRAALRNGSLN